jgi:hypothetical protein
MIGDGEKFILFEKWAPGSLGAQTGKVAGGNRQLFISNPMDDSG